MRIIITGATGLVGAEAVRQAIEDNEIEEIVALVRKPLDFQHPKVKTIIHSNYLDYSGLETVFRNTDAMLWCLGISQSQVSKEEYIVITYDYSIAAAKALLAVNPEITFLFVSGMGASSGEKSMTLFGRIKGKTENELKRLPFKDLYIVRPGGIKPIHKNKNTAFSNKIMTPLFPLMKLIAPFSVITSVELALVMLDIVKNGTENQLSENVDLLKILKTL